MLIILLILIFIRPFISSVASPILNYIHSLFLIILLIFWFFYRGRAMTKLPALKRPLALFYLALIVSISFSQDKLTSFEELYKYVCGLSLFVIAASLDEKGKNRLIYAILGSAIIISFIAIYQYFFGFKFLMNHLANMENVDPFVYDYIEQKRVFLPFVTPNILGGYLAMIIAACLFIKNRIWIIAPLLIALLLTKSIGALIALCLGLALYSCLRGKQGKKRVVFIFGLLLIIGVIFVARSAIQKEHTQPLFSAMARLDYWKDTLAVIKTHYLAGVGPGNFNLPQCRYTHNSYLQILAEMGPLGLIALLWLLFSVFRITFKKLKSSPHKIQIAALLAASVIFLAHNFIDFSFFLPEVTFIWWMITGLLLSFPDEKTQII